MDVVHDKKIYLGKILTCHLICVNYQNIFLTFPACSNLNSNCSNSLDMRNLQEQVKKTFCYQKLFWPFTVWIDSSDRKHFVNSRPSASKVKFQKFFTSLEQFFLTVGQNTFGNKIPFSAFSRLLRNFRNFYIQQIVFTICCIYPFYSIAINTARVHTLSLVAWRLSRPLDMKQVVAKL